MFKKGETMFKEWKAIFKKPTFIIVMIGVSLIPALYNIIFLSSMWDPYGQVSDLPEQLSIMIKRPLIMVIACL